MPNTGDSITTRMVNAKYISNLRLMGTFKKEPLAAKDRSVDLDGLIAKEEIAIRDMEKLGVGVTKEAQSIFDALSET
ncbi:unnamed protein product [Arabis nemorensis]|uniref:Uncharacterized protein n=1 Tax=Arabis nemorensis TaxID=586526 RepID=A0A565AZC9_9BRAS|nr:unnamed protein product [Arabis nemorensis]